MTKWLKCRQKRKDIEGKLAHRALHTKAGNPLAEGGEEAGPGLPRGAGSSTLALEPLKCGQWEPRCAECKIHTKFKDYPQKKP